MPESCFKCTRHLQNYYVKTNLLWPKFFFWILYHLFTSPNSSGRSRNGRISQWRALSVENKWSTLLYFPRQRGYETSILSMRYLFQDVENSLWTCKKKKIDPHLVFSSQKARKPSSLKIKRPARSVKFDQN